MQIVITAVGRQTDKRPIIIFCTKSNASAQMRFHIGKVDDIGGLRIVLGVHNLLHSGRSATPINRHRREFDFVRPNFPA